MASAAVASRSDLIAQGMKPRDITAAVKEGRLIRARRDCYVATDSPRAVARAVRLGGRLTCLSLLSLLGIYVFDCNELHVHLTRGSGRLRTPTRRDVRLVGQARTRSKVRLHWWPLVEDTVAGAGTVEVVDALVHAVLCQEARRAIATLDSALHLGMIRASQLADIFGSLPQKYRVLLPLIDGRAESGPETLVRLMVRNLGCQVVPQVKFSGIGRVDLLVDGWLVVECDSEKYHSGWKQQKADRHRDMMLAALGYTSLRLTAEAIMYRPEEVRAALRGLLKARAAAS